MNMDTISVLRTVNVVTAVLVACNLFMWIWIWGLGIPKEYVIGGLLTGSLVSFLNWYLIGGLIKKYQNDNGK